MRREFINSWQGFITERKFQRLLNSWLDFLIPLTSYEEQRKMVSILRNIVQSLEMLSCRHANIVTKLKFSKKINYVTITASVKLHWFWRHSIQTSGSHAVAATLVQIYSSITISHLPSSCSHGCSRIFSSYPLLSSRDPGNELHQYMKWSYKHEPEKLDAVPYLRFVWTVINYFLRIRLHLNEFLSAYILLSEIAFADESESSF